MKLNCDNISKRKSFRFFFIIPNLTFIYRLEIATISKFLKYLSKKFQLRLRKRVLSASYVYKTETTRAGV